MSIGLLFWVLMVLWAVFGFYYNWPASQGPNAFVPLGNSLLLFILLFLLGWAEFGFVVRGP